MLELSDIDFKAAIIKMLEWTITNTLSEKIENFRKESFNTKEKLYRIPKYKLYH